MRRVLRHVGVQQVQAHLAHVHLPDPGMQGLPLAVHADHAGVAVHVPGRAHGHLLELVARVALLLPGVGGHVLAEVAFAVQEPHADERDVQVAGGLQMVARQDAQAAGIDGQAHGDAVFQAEVGDAGRGLVSDRELEGRVLARQIVLQGAFCVGQALDEEIVARQLLDAPLGQAVQQQHRVLLAAHPEVVVDGGEDVRQVIVPGEPEVGRYVPQGLQLGRQFGDNAEYAQGLHWDSLIERGGVAFEASSV